MKTFTLPDSLADALIATGKELAVQDNLSTAYPIWVVMDRKKNYVGSEYSWDEKERRDFDSINESSLCDDCKKSLKEDDEIPEKCPTDMCDDDTYVYFEWVDEPSFWKGPAMFLTQKECQEHIDSCRYDYTDPRPYAYSAYNNDEIKPIMQALILMAGEKVPSNHYGYVEKDGGISRSISCERVFARASAWTFTIPPIKKLLDEYCGSGVWADPFAGYNSPAAITNDLDPEAPTTHHLEAGEFAKEIKVELDGVLFDPPYSYRQISEHYKAYGKSATAKDTSYNFYHRVMKEIDSKIKVGGVVISFGWNSNRFPKNMGYETERVLLVAHGMHHNDTIVTVQRKVKI